MLEPTLAGPLRRPPRGAPSRGPLLALATCSVCSVVRDRPLPIDCDGVAVDELRLDTFDIAGADCRLRHGRFGGAVSVSLMFRRDSAGGSRVGLFLRQHRVGSARNWWWAPSSLLCLDCAPKSPTWLLRCRGWCWEATCICCTLLCGEVQRPTRRGRSCPCGGLPPPAT